MWISNGVINTNAWGDPFEALPEGFRQRLRAMSADERSLLDAELWRYFENSLQHQGQLVSQFADPLVESAYEDQWLPTEALRALHEECTVEDVMAVITNLDPRWQIDAQAVIQQAVWQLDEPERHTGRRLIVGAIVAVLVVSLLTLAHSSRPDVSND